MSKVIEVSKDGIKFDDGYHLYSQHEECCETHSLDFGSLSIVDFDELTFDFSKEFFERVEGYGIRLIPEQKNCAVPIAGYDVNSGYYLAADLIIMLKHADGSVQHFDIKKCQNIREA